MDITRASDSLVIRPTVPVAPHVSMPSSAATADSSAATTAVSLSRAAQAMATVDAGGVPGQAVATQADVTSGQGDAQAAQSFVYGALGLDRPDETPRPENPYYTAGKWVSAAATVGTFVSLLA